MPGDVAHGRVLRHQGRDLLPHEQPFPSAGGGAAPPDMAAAL